MRLKSFSNFVFEKLGVSESSLMFSNTLYKRVKSLFVEFFNSGEDQLQKLEVINYRTLRPLIYDKELWSQFPVVQFEVQIDFNKLDKKEFEKRYGKNEIEIKTGGFASFFGNRNWSGYSRIIDPIKQITDDSVVIYLGVSIDLGPDFDFKNSEHKQVLDDDINSTIYHELNHCFEHYNRVKKKSQIIRPESKSFNTTLTYIENIWKFPKEIWKFWLKFAYHLYVSEFHETRANVQEIYYYIKKYPTKDLNEFRIYKIATEMQNFSADEYYNSLLSKISEHEPYKSIEKDVAERIKEMWVKTYKKECEFQRSQPVISYDTLNKMNCIEFLKYWQKRINKQGEIIKRKAHSIKANL